MGTIPEACPKCGGFVTWDTDDAFRCMMCAKRFYYFKQVASMLSVLALRQTRAQRDKAAHARYMRVYMRLYRERRKRSNGHDHYG